MSCKLQGINILYIIIISVSLLPSYTNSFIDYIQMSQNVWFGAKSQKYDRWDMSFTFPLTVIYQTFHSGAFWEFFFLQQMANNHSMRRDQNTSRKLFVTHKNTLTSSTILQALHKLHYSSLDVLSLECKVIRVQSSSQNFTIKAGQNYFNLHLFTVASF